MSIPSNTRRPHIAAPARVARDSDENTVNLDNVLRELIARVPDEKERARYAELLLGDKNALADRMTTAQDAADARFNRAVALARAGRLDEFAALAFGLPDLNRPDLNRIEAPAAVARRRTPASPGPHAAASRIMARDSAREAAAEASTLFPNMNRLAGGR